MPSKHAKDRYKAGISLESRRRFAKGRRNIDCVDSLLPITSDIFIPMEDSSQELLIPPATKGGTEASLDPPRLVSQIEFVATHRAVVPVGDGD